ncbi:putative ATPase [Colletotrichum karsti]|uniref:ATPase n=1 Tax=Colletotrichum karsti TaxID=1095194 RepID=A0A9P6HWU5_9PEZI|nr:putative ATPase [Colletotrichum karsti]KAF9869751.1 putative ATPase [Colletotrichum karsti]
MGFAEDAAWKLRCKVLPTKEKPGRSIADIEASLSENDPKKANPKNPTLGAEATVITLYEGKNSVPGIYDWVNHPPKQMSKKAAQIQNKPAIKVYKIKDLNKPVIGGRFSLAYHQIAIQSPVLVAALEPILKKENWFLNLGDVAFFLAPFQPLFFRYEEIVRLHRETEDASLKAYAQPLVQTLDQILGETRDKTRGLQANGLINFDLAWTLFSNGTVMYSSGCNTEMLSKVDDVTYVTTKTGKALRLNCKVLSFNGESFVWVEQAFDIPKFAGNKLITDLDHYPLQFHADRDQIKERLIARGKTVLDFQGLKYCNYNGIALGSEGKHNVEGRILVDVVGYRKYELTQGKREVDDPETQRNRATTKHNASSHVVTIEGFSRCLPADRPKANAPDVVEEANDKTDGAAEVHKHLNEKQQLHNKEQMLARQDDLCFLAPTIEGYALKNKLWLLFYVEDISPIVWNNEAYDHLVYNEEQKDLVLSFVENHGISKQHQVEDVIVGKGQGLIVLLSGPPGTGKTLTAEAVADRTHRPLFYLQAEDLGINAALLGAKLKHVFEMATDWEAVILLDEADVFMSKRHPHDIIRNELVSIFLRELEYFRGIIFLTTNLYETIDNAFRSRVSLHLRFSPLTQDARMQIWRKFLGRLPRQEVDEDQGKILSEEDIEDLSLWRLNGREIKNAVKMVTGWCTHKGHEMNLTRMEAGIRATTPDATKSGHPKDDDVLYDSRDSRVD